MIRHLRKQDVDLGYTYDRHLENSDYKLKSSFNAKMCWNSLQRSTAFSKVRACSFWQAVHCFSEMVIAMNKFATVATHKLNSINDELKHG